MDNSFLETQIDQVQADITAINAVLLQLAANPSKSFSINTGQTQESVTEKDIGQLQALRVALYNELVILEARLYGVQRTLVPEW